MRCGKDKDRCKHEYRLNAYTNVTPYLMQETTCQQIRNTRIREYSHVRRYGMVWYGMVWYGMVYSMVWYGMV